MKMIVIGMFLSVSAWAVNPNPGPPLKIELKNGKGESVGWATLSEKPDAMNIVVEVSKLSPGKHGIHIHGQGMCDGPDFKSAGGHFNPESKKHGLLNSEGPHEGDLPNLDVAADGKGKAVLVAKRAHFTPGSLYQSSGTALVIHAKEDDQKSDPAGNSGDRVACAVIHPPEKH